MSWVHIAVAALEAVIIVLDKVSKKGK